jgi:hypothetical protein
MAIRNLFSKRQRQARGEVSDVYTYDELSLKFRIQVIHILDSTFGKSWNDSKIVENLYDFIVSILLQEYGWLKLNDRVNPRQELHEFFLTTSDYEQALDVIEVSFQTIIEKVGGYNYKKHVIHCKTSPEDAVLELNHRFRENGIGYQFESGQLVRLDSAFVHAEIVKPALQVLGDPRFAGANEEFLSAHMHYREGRNEECLIDCCKAFESTMKTVCTIQNWDFKPTDNAKGLIAACINGGLFPSYLENQVTSLRTLFESGVPTVRNKIAGHGQGTESRSVPDFYARYVLNLTATTILFLAEIGDSVEDKGANA